MNACLGFETAADGRIICLDVNEHRVALQALGARCTDYLTHTSGGRSEPGTIGLHFLEMLKPRLVPAERGFVLGIFPPDNDPAGTPPALAGILYFLHPAHDPGTWYIPLMLLEPAARGRGLGSVVHAAFARWAAARGARRLVVAVARDNVRAKHFWCERLGYIETVLTTWRQPGAPPRRNPEFVRELVSAPVSVHRTRLRAA